MIKKINLLKFFKLEKAERPAIYALSFIVFIIINFFISNFSLRLDLSNGKAYTLSPSSKKILAKLDDLVNVEFFVSSNLPNRLTPLKNEVADFLNEYKKAGHGKLNIKILDPKKDEKAATEAKTLGVPELQFSQLEKDKYAISSAYFAIAILFGNKKVIIPQVTNIGDLEYNLTSAIYKVTNKEIAKIQLMGMATNTQSDPLSLFKQVAERQFRIEEGDDIKADTKTLIVFDNDQTPYSETQITNIKNYLNRGGKAIFFVDGMWINDNFTAGKANNNLLPILESYGVKINSNLILSASSELVNFGNETMQLVTPYPFWLVTNNFDQTSSYFSNVNQLTFPWVSSLNIIKKNGISLEALVKTTNKSWGVKENEGGISLNPQTIQSPKAADLKEFIISAQIKKDKTKIIVIPTSRFVVNQYLNQRSGNLEFALNALNELASDGALTGIRSRNVSFYPLPDLPETQKDIFKYANILLLPVLFGLIGAVRLIKRK